MTLLPKTLSYSRHQWGRLLHMPPRTEPPVRLENNGESEVRPPACFRASGAGWAIRCCRSLRRGSLMAGWKRGGLPRCFSCFRCCFHRCWLCTCLLLSRLLPLCLFRARWYLCFAVGSLKEEHYCRRATVEYLVSNLARPR